jgi:hypothetical protein
MYVSGDTGVIVDGLANNGAGLEILSAPGYCLKLDGENGIFIDSDNIAVDVFSHTDTGLQVRSTTGIAATFTGGTNNTGMNITGNGTGDGLEIDGTTTLTGAVAATNASNNINLGATSRAAIADAVWDEEDGVDGLTLREFVRGASAALLAKMSGGGSGTEVFRNVTDTKNRITATVDDNGNRTAVTLDLT